MVPSAVTWFREAGLIADSTAITTTPDGGKIVITTIISEDGTRSIQNETFNAQGKRESLQIFTSPGKKTNPSKDWEKAKDNIVKQHI